MPEHRPAIAARGLEVTGLSAGYGAGLALRGVDLRAADGDLVLVCGRNGSGRSTLLRALAGLIPRSGRATLDGHALADLPSWEIARLGLGYAPDTRDVFAALTVDENLRVVPPRARWCGHAGLYARFAPLAARRRVAAGRLSGGEQKLLAVARAALCAERLLLLDEPYEGLAEPMCAEVDALIADARGAGVIVFAVERDTRRLGAHASHCLLLGAGEVQYCGPPDAPAARAALLEWTEDA